MPAGVSTTTQAKSRLSSSLAGVFNASSTLFTIDFYQKIRPLASQHQLVWVGRVATGVMVLIALAWIPVIQGAKGLYDYLQGVQGYLGPPIFTVFFLGVGFGPLLGGVIASAFGPVAVFNVWAGVALIPFIATLVMTIRANAAPSVVAE